MTAVPAVFVIVVLSGIGEWLDIVPVVAVLAVLLVTLALIVTPLRVRVVRRGGRVTVVNPFRTVHLPLDAFEAVEPALVWGLPEAVVAVRRVGAGSATRVRLCGLPFKHWEDDQRVLFGEGDGDI